RLGSGSAAGTQAYQYGTARTEQFQCHDVLPMADRSIPALLRRAGRRPNPPGLGKEPCGALPLPPSVDRPNPPTVPCMQRGDELGVARSRWMKPQQALVQRPANYRNVMPAQAGMTMGLECSVICGS